MHSISLFSVQHTVSPNIHTRVMSMSRMRMGTSDTTTMLAADCCACCLNFFKKKMVTMSSNGRGHTSQTIPIGADAHAKRSSASLLMGASGRRERDGWGQGKGQTAKGPMLSTEDGLAHQCLRLVEVFGAHMVLGGHCSEERLKGIWCVAG